jgi:CheY-like chemotaxis protein
MPCTSVLVVEDDESIRETLVMFLKFEGYAVHATENGEEAVRLLPTLPPPCVIRLDLMMPVMDGWQFVEAVREAPDLARIPVLLVTAMGDRARSMPLAAGRQHCGPPRRKGPSLDQP